MGGLLNQPIKDVINSIEEFQSGKIVVFASAVQGWRKNMEDYYIHKKISDQITLIGVFDGHGGPQVAHYVAQVFAKQLKIQPNFKLKNYDKALTKTFKRVDEMIISDRGERELRKIRKQLGINKTENKKIGMQTGCTANMVLITKDKLYSANIGDTRSMLISRQKIQPLSQDHKPFLPYEKDRIKKAGGKVVNGRINGGLNISRAFGDFQLKCNPNKNYNEQMVTSIPQIIQFNRSQEQLHIVIASDGVWEHFLTKNQLFAAKLSLQINKSDGLYHSFMNKILIQNIGNNPESQIGCDNMTLIVTRLNSSR